MSNDRGGGRGYRGGAFRGGRGRGRGGGFFGGPTFGGADESPRGGRGRGGYRGRGRGGALTMQGQNAVGFDYSLLHAGRGGGAPAASPDNDIVLEPPRGYVHVVRPQHEGQPNRTFSSHTFGNAYARPALQGDRLASMLDVPPNGPRAMRLSGGTVMPARGTRSRGPAGGAMHFPHFPVPAPSWSRPAEATGDSAFLAGVGLGKLKGGPRSGDPAARRALLIPVEFVKATGLFRDSAMQEAEDLHGPTEASKEALAQGKSGRGLGFTETLPEPKQEQPADFKVDFDFTQDDDEDEDLAALLSAYPGAVRELQPNEAPLVDTSHLLAIGDSLFATPAASTSAISTPTKSISENEESEDEVILITQSAARGAPGESDSEEERQLDAILAAAAAQKVQRGAAATSLEAKPINLAAAEAFYIDTEPAQASEVATVSLDTSALGDAPPAAHNFMAICISSDTDDYTDTEAPNLTQRQPRGQGKKARNAAKKARRRARKAEPNDAPRAPREGDSDLEWGEDGPPRLPEQLAEMSEDKELSTGELVAALKLGGSSSSPFVAKPKGRAKKQTAAEAYLQDLIAAAELGAQPASDEEIEQLHDDGALDKPTQLDSMISFMNSMDGQRGGQQVTLEDIAIEQRMGEEEEWMTESESGEERDDLDGDETMQEVQAYEERLLVELSSSSEDSDSTDSEDSDEQALPRGKGKSRAVDEDDEFTWADADEEFIGMLEKVAQDNDHILKGRNRTERNKLFRAIERGDFGNLDDFEEDDDAQPVKGGHAGKKKWSANAPFADDLQLQWEKDRATKAANKRKRAAERAAAAQDPYQNTHKKGSKKAAKKAARAARRKGNGNGSHTIDSTSDDAGEESDTPVDKGSFGDHPSKAATMRYAANLHELDVQIQHFLRDNTHSALSLPPMDKLARAQVHMLAGAYNLTSKSRGDGTNRFTVLTKNSRSGQNINSQRIQIILSGGNAGFGNGVKWAPHRSKKKSGGGAGGGRGAASAVPRNKEGAEVGHGAEKIGEDNIGHKLLTMMGWKEGSGVGASPGSTSAIGATIKVSKGGLGFQAWG